MKVEYLKKMDRVARAAGSREPDDVLESLGYVFMDPGNTVDGFIMKRNKEKVPPTTASAQALLGGSTISV